LLGQALRDSGKVKKRTNGKSPIWSESWQRLKSISKPKRKRSIYLNVV